MVKIKRILSLFGQGCLIAFIVILFVCPFSCNFSEKGIEIIDGDYISPKMNDCFVIDSHHIGLDFTENVNLSSISVAACGENCSSGQEDIVANNKSLKCVLSDTKEFEKFFNDNNKLSDIENIDVNENFKIVVGLDEETEIGRSYVISGVVEDKSGNSLTFSAPFKGHNDNIPKMIITEVQHESVGGSKKLGLYRGEFIRLLALEDGNLFGLEIGCASKPKKNYVFPVIKVSKGENIIVHLQKKGNGCISENGNDLNLAFNDYSEDGIRDLWRDSDDSIFGNSCDVIYLKNNINNKIIDGIAYTDGKKAEWPEGYNSYLKDLCDSGIFNAVNIDNACDVRKVTSLNTLKRGNTKDIENKLKRNETVKLPLFTTKDDWIVTRVKDNMITR